MEEIPFVLLVNLLVTPRKVTVISLISLSSQLSLLRLRIAISCEDHSIIELNGNAMCCFVY